MSLVSSRPPSSCTDRHTRSSRPDSLANYLPFASPSYTAPNLPADSFSVLVYRLSALESAVGQLSHAADARTTRVESDRQRLSSQIGGLQDEGKRVAQAMQSSSRSQEDVSKAVKGIKGEIESLVDRVKVISQDRVVDVREMGKLRDGIAAVSKDVVAIGKQVARVSEEGVDRARVAKVALDAIEARLPSRIAVRLDDAGQLVVDPAFWKYLRGAFVEKADLAKLVDVEFKRSGKRAPSSSYSSAPSWDAFLAENEASLRAWVESDVSSRLSSDAIVSRKTFLDVLHREIKKLKADFEVKSNENVEAIGQELLAKVALQDRMRAAPPPSSSSPVDAFNITALIDSVVDSALLRYSKDVLARPDYALYTAGARVIPSITSRTYEARPVGLTPQLLGWVTGRGATPGRPPVTALHPDISLGSCWPFAGSQGQLGILLNRRVVPTDVTIEHASVDVALLGDVSSAPKDFEVWGVVEGREDIERLQAYRSERAESRKASGDDDEPTSSMAPTPNHILLVAGSYDTSSPSHVQTFPVTTSARQLAIPVGVVVVKILSNHGDSHYTCLYRVRVSGSMG